MVAVQDRRRLAPARWPGDVPRLRGFSGLGDVGDVRSLIGSTGDILAATEAALTATRAALVDAGRAMAAAGAGVLPEEVVDAYHVQRSQLAQRVVAFIERLESYAESVPVIGGWLRAQLEGQFGDPYAWGDEILRRLPPLPADVVPNPKPGFNPLAGYRGFGFVPALAALAITNPVGTAVAGVALAGLLGVAAWGATKIIQSFNLDAQTKLAEAERLRATAELAGTMAAAGTDGATIAAMLKKVAKPPPSWVEVAKWGGVAAGVAGAIYLLVRFLPRGKKPKKEAAA